ncbi:DUF1345 domain-containing protein [Brevundimonas diminuta]|uniref:DUF1345 domain-containing protein n=1 Tax=Brevundimonas diminuta TaxID=293 RepID=UPI002096D860|nr:DUF1345 domain-containing protein [Brevundimonas diminuta]MCO8020146.1 DUF1345 domain-containing protein [Brevundimonas diminuta]MCO8022951.1 DUF1345 domain-containing protein [Brevundimonas diminuta]
MKSVARLFRLHFALWLGLAVMAAASAVSPVVWGWPVRLGVAWDAGVAAFLLLTFVRLSRTRSVAEIRARAAELDQAGGAVLPLSLLAAGASVFVIVFMAASGGKPTATAAVLTVATIALSWLFVQTIFTLHYAHEFYAPAEADDGDRQGLMFPGEEDADYWDFLHFALIIGVANQTADVQISSQRLRRIATVHSIVAWLFNTVILALAVNLAVNLL